MSYFTDSVGVRHALFGEGGGAAIAASLGTDLLGHVPLVPAVRSGGDAGRPIVVDEPAGETAQVFQSIGRALWAKLEANPVANLGNVPPTE